MILSQAGEARVLIPVLPLPSFRALAGACFVGGNLGRCLMACLPCVWCCACIVSNPYEESHGGPLLKVTQQVGGRG